MGSFTIGTTEENSSTGLIIVGAAVLLLIGLYYMARKNNPLSGISPGIPLPDMYPSSLLPASTAGLYPGQGVPGISPSLNFVGGSTGPIPLGSTIGGLGSTIPDPYTTTDKTGLPIISPSTGDLTNPESFAPTAAGTCQCTDSECCVWSPFMSPYGIVSNYQSTRVCVPVAYGNSPQACNAAMSQYTQQTAGVLKAQRAQAHDAMVHYTNRPVKARKAHNLLISRAARARMYV